MANRKKFQHEPRKGRLSNLHAFVFATVVGLLCLGSVFADPEDYEILPTGIPLQAMAAPGKLPTLFKKESIDFIGKETKALFVGADSSGVSDVYGMLLFPKGKPAFLSNYLVSHAPSSHDFIQAEIQDAFVTEVGPARTKRLFVICRWPQNGEGDKIEGYDYKVFAYRDTLVQGEGGYFLVPVDAVLSDQFGQGSDGKLVAKGREFKYRTANDILKKVRELSSPAAKNPQPATASISTTTATIKQLTAKLKSVGTESGIRASLSELGIPQDSIKHMKFTFSPPESQNGMHVERAETFLEDLDGDGKKEAVSQVIFSDEPEYGKSGLEYLIMVHKSPDQPNSLAYFRTFNMMRCGYVKASGLNFSFLKNKSAKGAKVLFRITQVSECSVDGQKFSQSTDTLSVSSGTWKYSVDPSPKSTSRKGDPEGP